jgi:hypothetical protein
LTTASSSRLDPFFATSLDFFLADILDVGAEHPFVAEWIHDSADAIAPELVLDRLHDLGAGLHRAIDRCVRVGHVDHEAAGRAAARFRAQRIQLGISSDNMRRESPIWISAWPILSPIGRR